jgi:hypothetical protein
LIMAGKPEWQWAVPGAASNKYGFGMRYIMICTQEWQWAVGAKWASPGST